MNRSDRVPDPAPMLRFYPQRWRARYGDEMAELLAADPPSLRDRVDLLRGAIDAHLHPPTRSTLPPIAALTAGAAWVAAALAIAREPAPPDWPGYTLDVVPIALIGSSAALVAIVGAWLRLGDSGGGLGRIALDVAVAGHLAWVAALVGVLLGIDYGASTALAANAAAIGTALVALALLRAADWPLAILLAAAAASAGLPVPGGWLGFGLAWTAIGLIEWRDVVADRERGPGREARFG